MRDQTRFIGNIIRFVLAAALMVIGVPVLALATASSASAAVNGGYEIDGDKPVNAGGIDADSVTYTPDPYGSVDTSQYGPGSAETNPTRQWTSSTGTTPGKSDFTGAWADTHTEPGGHTWTYFAFERQDTSGTTAYDVEFNQLPNLPGNPPRPNRTDGDLLIQAIQNGNSSFKITGAFVYMSDLAKCIDPDTKLPIPKNDQIAIKGTTGGWCPLKLPAGSFFGATSTDGTFAEGTLDLTALFNANNSCLNDFGVMNMRSRSADSATSSLGDWVKPAEINVTPTCPAAKIYKVDIDGEPLVGATFTISPAPDPKSTANSTATIKDGGVGDADGQANGVIVLDPIGTGRTYTVTETIPPTGYLLPATRSQQLVVGPNGSGSPAPITFVDPEIYEKPVVTKTADGTHNGTYTWSIEKDVNATTFQVKAGQSATANYTVKVKAETQTKSGYTVTGVLDVTNPNAHPMTVTFADPMFTSANWACTGVPTDVDTTKAGLQVTLQPGLNHLAGNVDNDYKYSCAWKGEGVPADATNTATLTWSRATYPQTQADVDTPAAAGNDTATGSDPYDFTTEAASTNKTVTVSDVFNGADPVRVGGDQTLTWVKDKVYTITYSKTITAPDGKCQTYDNTATINETDQSSSESVTVCAALDPKITKNAAILHGRQYIWDVVKSGDDLIWAGGTGTPTATASYTVDLIAKEVLDSDIRMIGAITLSNRNEWPVTVNVTDVADLTGSDIKCTIAGGAQDAGTATVTIPANTTALEVRYTCTMSQPPADPATGEPDYSGATNTASMTIAAGDAHIYPGVAANYSNKVDVASVTEETSIDKVVTVDDSMYDGPALAGTFDWEDVYAMAGHKKTFTYTVDLSAAAGTCNSRENVFNVLGDGVVVDSDSHTTQVCAPGVTKTAVANYDVNRRWEITKKADQTKVVVGPDGSAQFTYTVKAKPLPTAESDITGATFTGEITVTNPSDVALPVDITDLSGVEGWTCTVIGGNKTVPANGSVTVSYTCSGDGTRINGTNTANVTYQGTSLASPVTNVNWAVDQTTNNTVTVQDPMSPTGTLGTATWNAAGTATNFEYSKTLNGVSGTCTAYDNTATAYGDGDKPVGSASETVEACSEKPLTVTKTADASFTRQYLWDVTKTADDTARVYIAEGQKYQFGYTVTATGAGTKDSDFVVTGTITVTNDNNWKSITATVTDKLSAEFGGFVCTVTDGENVEVAKNASVELSYSCKLPATAQPQKTAGEYAGVNTASATWTNWTDAEVTSKGTKAFTATETKSIDKSVDVYDDKTTGTEVKLSPAATYPGPAVYKYTVEKTGVAGTCTKYDNTARVDVTGTNDPTDSAQVELCVGKNLTISKDAKLTYQRQYNWAIKKTGDGTVFATQNPDGTYSATLNYSVEVTAKDYTDSAQVVTGKVTVNNPNDWAVDATVTDIVTINGTPYDCTLTTPTKSVPSKGSAEFPYTCTGIPQSALVDGYTGTNSATAEWDATEAHSSASSATTTVDVNTIPPAAPKNEAVTITDSMGDTFGPLKWSDVYKLKDHTKVFSYTKTKTTTEGACTAYPNTVTIDGTTITDTVTTDVCALEVKKTVAANYGETRHWTVTKEVDKTKIEIGPDGKPTLHYTVVATPNGSSDNDVTWNGSITVKNPSTTKAVEISVVDTAAVSDWTCKVGGNATVTLSKGETGTFGYTCTGTNPAKGTNTVEVTFDGGSISKTVPVEFVRSQDPVNQTIQVTDTRFGTPLGDAVWNAEGTPTTFEYDYTPTGLTVGACTMVDNTASVPGVSDTVTTEVCVEAPLTMTKTVSGTFDRLYKWSITKTAVAPTEVEIREGESRTFRYTVTATPTTFVDSGYSVKGTITLTNPNKYDASAITAKVTDELSASLGGQCVVAGGASVTVTKDAPVTLDYACNFPQAPKANDAGEYTGTNTATATWNDPDGKLATATVTTKPFTLALAEKIDFQVPVYDDKTKAGEQVLLGTAIWDQGPQPFSYDLTFTGEPGTETAYKNVAWVDVTKGEDPKDDETVVVKVEKAPVVTKTANATFTRTYHWKVEKAAEATDLVVNPATGKATANYTVKVSADGYTDSAWKVTGQITVRNPNTYADGELTVTVADLPAGLEGANCSLKGSAVITVAPGATSAPIGYECTFDNKPAYTGGTNTATATYDPAGPATTATASSAAVPVEFAVGAEVHKTVQVVDDKTNPATPVVLDPSLEWKSDLVKTYTYSLELAGVAGGTKDYKNTVWVQDSGDTTPTPGEAIVKDDETVTVRYPLDVTPTVTGAGSYDVTYPWSIAKKASTSVITGQPGEVVPVNYTVTVTPGAAVRSGYEIGGTVVLTNPNTTAKTVTLSQTTNIGGTANCSFTGGNTVELAAKSQSAPIAWSCVLTGTDYRNGSTTITATWDNGKTSQQTHNIVFSVDTKTNETIHVVDDKTVPGTSADLGTVTWSSDLKPTDFTYTLPITLPATSGSFTNVATIVETKQDDSTTVKAIVENAPVVTKTAVGTLTRDYHWSIDKQASATQIVVDPATGKATANYTVKASANGFTDSAWKVTGTIKVTNPNTTDNADQTVTLADVPVGLDGAACSYDSSVVVTLAPGASKEIGYTCTFASKPSYDTGSNTATVTYDPAGPQTSKTVTSAAVPVSFAPATELHKTVQVVDDKTNPGTAVVLDASLTWEAGLTKTYTYSLALDGKAGGVLPHTNTVWVQDSGPGTPTPEKALVKDTETVTVSSPLAVSVGQAAAASYDATYAWVIGKAAATATITGLQGSTHAVPYTVSVTPAARTQSGYELSGSVVLTNPNETAKTITLSQVVTVGGPTTCTIAGGNTVEVAAKSQVTKTWSCVLSGTGYTDGKSTITATWDGKSAVSEQPITFAVDKETNKTINVVDDQTKPGTSVALGTATWNATGTPVVFNYSLDLVIGSATQTFVNTAMVVETKQTAQAPVKASPLAPAPGGGGGQAPPTVGKPPMGSMLPSTGAPAGLVLAGWLGLGSVLAGLVLLARSRRREA